MALVKRSIRELYQGISQQPDGQRLHTQGESMINGIPSVSQGLLKRPSSVRLVGMISPIGFGYVKTFMVRRDNGELNYWVLNTRTGYVYIYDTEGALLLSYASSYISDAIGNPEYLDLLYSGNEVTILNTNKTVGTTSIASGGLGYQDLEYRAFIKVTGKTATSYLVQVEWFNGTSRINTTLSFSSGAANAEALVVELKAALDAVVGHPVSEARGSTWYFPSVTEAVSFLSISDTSSNTDLISCAGYGADTESFFTDTSLLPTNVDLDHKVHIGASGEDGYYLEFQRDGVWRETVKGTNEATFDTGLDPGTMPLFFEDNAFVVNAFDRLVEVDFPEFVGDKITSMFYYQNRLTFTSGKSATFSEIDFHSQFFKSTAASVVSSDAVELSLPDGPEQEQLISGVPQDQSLMLFGNTSQYVLTTLDLSEAQLLHVGTCQVSNTVKPVDVANRTYFASNNAEYSIINSLYRVDNIGNYDVDNESAHIPYLIKGDIVLMKYCPTENMMFSVSSNDTSKVFVQNTFKTPQGRIQNAWHTWEFDGAVDAINIIGSTVYINIIKQGDLVGADYNANLEVVQIFLGDTQRKTPSSDTSIKFIPYLDSMDTVNQATFTNYAQYDRDIIGVDDSGSIYEGTSDIQTYLDTLGPTDEIYVGHSFKFYYEFSKQLPSHYVEGTKVLETFNNLILRRLKVSFFDTAEFLMKTYQDLRGTEYSQKFEADAMNTDLLENLGRINITDGTFNFPVNSKSDDCRISIESESPFPCNFTSAEWSGNLIRKGSRY